MRIARCSVRMRSSGRRRAETHHRRFDLVGVRTPLRDISPSPRPASGSGGAPASRAARAGVAGGGRRTADDCDAAGGGASRYPPRAHAAPRTCRRRRKRPATDAMVASGGNGCHWLRWMRRSRGCDGRAVLFDEPATQPLTLAWTAGRAGSGGGTIESASGRRPGRDSLACGSLIPSQCPERFCLVNRYVAL